MPQEARGPSPFRVLRRPTPFDLCTGTLERAGGEGVDHAMGTVFSPQIVSIAHRVAQVLLVAFNNDRLGSSNDAQQSSVELHVRTYISGLVRNRAVQVNNNTHIYLFDFSQMYYSPVNCDNIRVSIFIVLVGV